MNTNDNIETIEEKTRREWAESGADWAWGVLRFLQGRRINEVSVFEVEQTRTFENSSEAEQSSLRFVASESIQKYPPNEEDRRRLRERDDFLVRFAAGETLGHGDWVAEIRNIPAGVARAQAVDASMFPKTYQAPELFTWLWKR